MIGVTAKIGEFFASLLSAMFFAGVKVAFAGLCALALLLAAVIAIQWLLARRRNR